MEQLNSFLNYWIAGDLILRATCVLYNLISAIFFNIKLAVHTILKTEKHTDDPIWKGTRNRKPSCIHTSS